MKTKPGDYVIAFYGSAVAKYRYNLEAVRESQKALDQAKRQKAAEAAIAAAELQLKNATAKAQPKDIVDIVVSKPFTIRVKPAVKIIADKAEQE